MTSIARRVWAHLRKNKMAYLQSLLCFYVLVMWGPSAISGMLHIYDHWGDASRIAEARCDRVVGSLLTTMDPVEIQRAGVILQHMDCSVSNRLPK